MRMLLVFAFLFLPVLVFAQPVVINEIAWLGSPVEGVEQNQWWRYEWLELYNVLEASVALDGWAIELSKDKLNFRIPLHGIISPSGYFLIGASDKILNVDLNYKNLAGKFNNSGQKVVLKNNTGKIIDEVDATKGWSAGDNESKATMERDADFLAWHTSSKAGGTPKAQNSIGLMAQKRPVIRRGGESDDSPKKDLRGSSLNLNPLFIAVPGAVLAGALALAARKFLYKA